MTAEQSAAAAGFAAAAAEAGAVSASVWFSEKPAQSHKIQAEKQQHD
jgi:hypothetical protein